DVIHAVARNGDLRHVGRLGRLVGPRGTARAGEVDRWNAVPPRGPRRMPGHQPAREKGLCLTHSALARQPGQVLRDDLRIAVYERPHEGVGRDGGLLRLHAIARLEPETSACPRRAKLSPGWNRTTNPGSPATHRELD